MLRSARLSFPLLLLCLLLPACDSNDNGNEDRTIFEIYDADGNGAVSFDEFGVLLNQQFPFRKYDTDGSGNYSADELNGLARFVFDPEQDGIDAEEFTTGIDFFFGDESEQAFGDYDADENGTIEADEFDAAFGEQGTFAALDTSGDDLLSVRELAQGFFDFIDRDGDGTLDETEFNEGVGTLLGVDLPRQ